MGRRPAQCAEGTWSASEIAERLSIPRERIKGILRALSEGELGTGRGRFRCFAPRDVMTIVVADRLISEGVRPSRVREACRYLRQELRAGRYPLTEYTLFTDGTTVLVRIGQPSTVIDVAAQGQLVFALALHDLAVVCERAGFLRPAQPRFAQVEAAVQLRWATAEPPR